MNRLFFGGKPLRFNQLHFFVAIFAIATILVVSFPSGRLFAAAETLNCDGNSRTISVGTYTDSTGDQFSSGADLTLAQGSGACTFTLTQLGNASSIELSSLNVESGVTLTHAVAVTTDGTYNKIDLNISGDLVIDTGGSINVSEKGLISSGGSSSGYGIYDGVISSSYGSTSGSGGSHGGPGGRYTDFSFNATVPSQYDSFTNPIYPGGSGNFFNGGAIGGGVLRIVAANATVSGTISANAKTIGFVGEGAGGTVYLNISGDLNGNGTISANGGGGASSYGGGGGGRIAVYYTNISSSLTFSAQGGNSSISGADGGAGTVYKKPASQQFGDLFLDNGSASSVYYATEMFSLPSIPTSDAVAIYGGGYVFNSVNLSNNAVLDVPTSLDSTGDGTPSRTRKFYIVNDCDATALDTTVSNGQIQWGSSFILSAAAGSNYTCVSPEYIIEFSLAASSGGESVTNGTIEIVAIGPASTTTFVDYTVSIVSSTATGGGVDFTLADGTATLNTGETTTTISFTVIDDEEMESDETIYVALSNPVDGTIGTASSHTYTIEDNDTPGVTVDVGSGVSVTEGSDTLDTYTLVLDSMPTATVTIQVSGDDQVTTTVDTFEFTPENWNVLQVVTVSPINDSIAEGSHTGTSTHSVTSADLGYNGVAVDSVTVTISDNDFAGVTLTQSGGSTVVSENGATDSYTLVLNTIPTAPVTVGISVNEEGTVSTSSIVFATSTWNVPQTVTVTAVDDMDSDQWDSVIISHTATSDDSQYNGVFINSIFASVIDNESPAVTVTASGGSTNIREGGVTDTFSVNLETAPASDVTITLDGGTDISPSPSELIFTAENWLTPQVVTLTAIDDENFEGGDFSSVAFTASSADAGYNGLFINSFSVTVYDNDGIIVTESGASTDVVEGGATDSFEIVLDQNPFSDLTIYLTTSTQYSLSTTTLYFHFGDWDTPQTVTVSAVDDAFVEGIHTALVSSTISTFAFSYSYTEMQNITINITDNDAPSVGVTVAESGGATSLTESGVDDSYTLVLDTMPAADVTIDITPDDQSTLSTSSIVFTVLNWDTPQTVTATAVDDFVAEGGHTSTITHSVTSADGDYEGVVVADVVASITDNDSAGISVSTISASTTESGVTSTFTVVLDSQPTGTVEIPIASSDTTEGIVSTSTLTFNPENWDTVRTIIVTGVDDDIADGDISYTISVLSASSTDPNYDGVDPSNVTVENIDNDVVGITLTESGGSTDITEVGGTDSYTIVLDTQPVASVTVTISPDTESTVSTSSILFTTTNWDTPQTITVSATNDNIDEGNHTSTITHDASSADGSYENLVVSNITANITDNDTAGVTVSLISGNTDETGATSTFTVVLDSRPVGNVEIPVSSLDITEGSVSTSSLVFTPSDWSLSRTVIVTGQDDVLSDGNIDYTITVGVVSSSDPNYDGINPDDVSVTNIDDDIAGITVTAISGNTTEAGGTATFTVVLDTQPAASVFVGISSSDVTEGTVSTSSLTFTTANWDTPQIVTVTGVNDDIDDGDVIYSIGIAPSTSADGSYNGINPADVSVTNIDNDTTGVTISTDSVNTTEAGDTDNYTIVLDTQPTNSVTLNIASDSQSSVSTSSILFTTTTWNVPQTIVVSAINDDIDDVVNTSTISHSATSADGNYNEIAIESIINTITDNDTAGISVSSSSGSTTEGGGTATYTVVLNTQPTDTVTIPVSSGDLSEGIVSTSSLVFTQASWNLVRTVTITGVDDDVVDGNVAFTLINGITVSNDLLYAGLNPANVTTTNTDDDIPEVIITQSGGSTTLSENGGTDSYTLVLNSEPTNDVTINLIEGDGIIISTSSIVFSSSTWDTAQTIIVTGVDNADIDGDRTSTVAHLAISDDTDYDEIDIDDITVNISDDETVVEPEPPVSHNGGGGGNSPSGSSNDSSGSTDTSTPDTENPTSETPTTPTTPILPVEETVTLDTASRQQVVIGTSVHHVTRISATEQSATILLESDPITLTLQKDKIKRVDTDGDKKVDLSVTYLGLINGAPKFVFATIVSSTTPGVPVLPNTTPGGVRECPLLRGNPYKLEGGPAVYLVDVAHNPDGSINTNIPCAKRAFVSADQYFTYFESWKNIHTVVPQLLSEIPNDSISSIPKGPRLKVNTGSLIKLIDDPKVYLIVGPQRHWIQTEVIFRALGYLFSWVDDVGRETFNSFSEGKIIDEPVRPVGTLIRYPQTDTIYRIVENGSVLEKQPVDSTETLTNYNKDRVVTVSGSELYPQNKLTPTVSAFRFSRFLSQGASGEDVLALQNILKNLGYLTATPNGNFGPATLEAVKKFQQDRDIDVRGYVGPATRNALNTL